MLWIWRFLKSMPLVFHVFIAVAVMVYLLAVIVCGRHGIGPVVPHVVGIYLRTLSEETCGNGWSDNLTDQLPFFMPNSVVKNLWEYLWQADEPAELCLIVDHEYEPIPWWPQTITATTMTATNHDGYKPWPWWPQQWRCEKLTPNVQLSSFNIVG